MASMPPSASVGGPPLRPLLDPLQPGRVDEPDVRRVRTQRDQRRRRPGGTATAGAADPARRRGRRSTTGLAGSACLEVERQVVVGAAALEQVGELGMCSGSWSRRSVGDPPPAPADPHHAVVVEHRDAVGGQPHVALEPGGAEREGQLRTPRGCSRGRGPGRPGGRTRSGVRAGREPLLHAADDGRPAHPGRLGPRAGCHP